MMGRHESSKHEHNLLHTMSNQPPSSPPTAVTGWQRTLILFLQQAVYQLASYWHGLFLSLFVLFLALGFLAPALMAEGQEGAATAVYRFMRIHNHQLPERSYFLFGSDTAVASYELEQLLAAGVEADTRTDFVGNGRLGYKTALNHRMIAIFVGLIVGAFSWIASKGRLNIGLLPFLFFLLPLLLDGYSHMFSEQGSGFRQSNDWLIALTGGRATAVFYSGTAVGTFNWWLRNLTGFGFGLGLVWFTFPNFARYFQGVRKRLSRLYS